MEFEFKNVQFPSNNSVWTHIDGVLNDMKIKFYTKLCKGKTAMMTFEDEECRNKSIFKLLNQNLISKEIYLNPNNPTTISVEFLL
jgi:hypothetical protein